MAVCVCVCVCVCVSVCVSVCWGVMTGSYKGSLELRAHAGPMQSERASWRSESKAPLRGQLWQEGEQPRQLLKEGKLGERRDLYSFSWSGNL